MRPKRQPRAARKESAISSDLFCPLCAGGDTRLWHRDSRREYWHCDTCGLVQVPPAFHLAEKDEKAIYDQHDNRPDDPGYRRFLARLAGPLLARLPAGACGLDFGCGPGPALAQMLAEAGHRVSLFDKFYHPDSRVWQQTYDFICATEVFEHLAAPAVELDRLLAHLRPGGWLGIMTKRVRDQSSFSRWHYIQDPTHIVFFSDATFHWIGRRRGLAVEWCGSDVVLLRKPGL